MRPTAGDVGDGDELADGRESSLLSLVESAAARAQLRRLRRSAMCRLLRRLGRPSLSRAMKSSPRLAGGGCRSASPTAYRPRLELYTNHGRVRNELDAASASEPSEEAVEIRARTGHGDIT